MSRICLAVLSLPADLSGSGLLRAGNIADHAFSKQEAKSILAAAQGSAAGPPGFPAAAVRYGSISLIQWTERTGCTGPNRGGVTATAGYPYRGVHVIFSTILALGSVSCAELIQTSQSVWRSHPDLLTEQRSAE